jgi:diguanylate cyclase (GGDEF)-like protein/PAS domain S-box-containing protein
MTQQTSLVTRGALHWWVVLPVVLLVMSIVSFMSWNAYTSDVASADDLVRAHMRENIGRVQDTITQQLEHTNIAMRAAKRAYADRQFDLTQADRSQRYLARLTELTTAVSNIYVGDSLGNFVGVFRGEPQAHVVGLSRVVSESTTRFAQELNDDGSFKAPLERLNRVYDPRTRPWWAAASTTTQPVWTSIYTNSEGTSLELTRAMRLDDGKPGSTMVIGATDIRLEVISEFLKRAPLTKSGVAFVMDEDRLMVASTSTAIMRKDANNRAVRFTADDTGNPFIASSARVVSSVAKAQPFSGIAFFDEEVLVVGKSKASQLMIAATKLESAGLPLYLVVAAPRADYLGDFINDARRAMLVNLSVALGSLIVGLVLLGWVINRRAQAEKELQAFGQALTQTSDPVVMTDKLGRVTYANAQFCSLAQKSLEDIKGRDVNEVYLSRGGQDNTHAVKQAIAAGADWRGTVAGRNVDGTLHYSELTLNAMRNEQGNITSFVGVEKDVTEREIASQRLQHEVMRDALTQSLNRTGFNIEMDAAVRARKARRDMPFATGFIDLDGFKGVNDQYGHQAGDQVLIQVAQRVRELLRPGDTLARLGGDEFVVILLDTGTTEMAMHVGNKIIESVNEPMRVSTDQGTIAQVHVGASVGLAIYPFQAEQPEQLLKLADAAMYEAKRSGKNRCVVAG